jgi:HlyD family secretion protein
VKTWIKTLITVAVIGVLAGVGVLIYRLYASDDELEILTEEIAQGDLMNVISASGTVEPEELVNVGAQVSGKIMSFGADADGKTVDFGSQVTKGLLLAKIDDGLYDAALRKAKAQKSKAEASILSAEASKRNAEAALKQAQAQLALAKSNFERAEKRKTHKAISDADFDAAKSDYEVRGANVAAAEASCRTAEANKKTAEADLAIAEAALYEAQRNLDYCTIKSPVDGVVIERRVSVGQTLVSNMSASTIFLIAKDLKKMNVWVSVNEADIGNIYVGMPVVFTVDAFPGMEFEGKVHKIRLNATMSQNVVTYVVEVATDNKNGKLLPYLTANVKFIRARRDNVLNISNAALRFRPPEDLVAPESRKMLENYKRERGKGLLWVKTDKGKLRPVEVKTGINDGKSVEIVTDKLKKGDVIVNGVRVVTAEEKAQKQNGSRSPFLPDPPKRRGNNPNKPEQSGGGPRR